MNKPRPNKLISSKITINITLLLAAQLLQSSFFLQLCVAFTPSAATNTKICFTNRPRLLFLLNTKTIPSIGKYSSSLSGSTQDEPLEYDDDDDYWEEDEDEDAKLIARLTQQNQRQKDFSGCSSRQFSLGYDIQLTAYVGNLGFEEVTDWEYYDPNDASIVDPPPFDPDQPKRTREKSGSVVRIFRGELIGLANKARSLGLDTRVLVKEFSGEFALRLAKAEVESLTQMQSTFCYEVDSSAKNGEWTSSASMRYLMGRTGSTKEDDNNLLQWMDILNKKSSQIPYIGLLGELNLSEFFENNDGNVKNEWYRALSVPPPQPDSLWLVYEYTGLTTVGVYAKPALTRWSNLPLRKNFWGSLEAPPALPPWQERSKYVVKGILRGCLEALSKVHSRGIVHRSIGRNSIILCSVGQDKTEASSPYATVIPRLRVKLTDFGFSGRIVESSDLEDFRSRARTFKLNIQKGSSSVESKSYAIAEDLHAMGFVFVALILSSLAEVPSAEYVTPPTDEDSLQRLMADIFNKDMGEFRAYCEAEEIWSRVVELLAENDGIGWNMLEEMCFARERVAQNLSSGQMLTAESLLTSPFFS